MVKTISRKVRKSWLHGWGKVRRFCLAALMPGAVKRHVERRRGECTRCGACCKLVYKCPALFYQEDGTAGCRYHQVRPMNCRVFPIDERDLADRDMVMPEQPCGYSFLDASELEQTREAGS